MSTRRYLISKVLQAILTLAFVLAFNFFLFRAVGDPVTQLLRGHSGISAQAVLQLQRQLALSLLTFGGGNPSKCPGADRYVGVAENRRVEHIVKFGAELQVHAFPEGQRNAFDPGHVRIE